MPKISVIVPVCKVEKYLNRCVDSILNQTFKDFELILVDDGSPDNCPAICDDYASKYDFVHVIHKENGGLASARNAGMRAAIGDYICFIDSDDFVGENYLFDFVKAIKSFTPDIIQSGLTYYPSMRFLSSCFVRNEVYKGIDMINTNPRIFSNIGIPFSVRYCFRRLFLKNQDLFFNEKIKYAEDSPFNIEAIALSEKMVCIDSFEYKYCCENTASITKRYKPTMVEDSDKYHAKKMMVANLLLQGKFDYMVDMTSVHLFCWLPSCIKNYKDGPYSFSLVDAKKLLNANFVQDCVEFYLTNRLYKRKLQLFYYRAIRKKKKFLLYFIWKYWNLDRFIG